MSRSVKKNQIIKDKGFSRGEYYRVIRRRYKQKIQKWFTSDRSDPEFPNKHSIINQCDRCDWIFRDENNPKFIRK